MKYCARLSVAIDDLMRPCKKVFRPTPLRLSSNPKLKIIRGIVLPVAIYMVYVLIWIKLAAKSLFHDKTVLQLPVTRTKPNLHITSWGNVLAASAINTLPWLRPFAPIRVDYKYTCPPRQLPMPTAPATGIVLVIAAWFFTHVKFVCHCRSNVVH